MEVDVMDGKAGTKLHIIIGWYKGDYRRKVVNG